MSNDFFNNIDGGIDEFNEMHTEQILEIISALPAPVDPKKLSKNAKTEDDNNEQMDFVLRNLQNSSKVSELAIAQVFKLAASSDSPRAWEVLSTLLKTQIDSAKTIADIITADKKASVPVNQTLNQTNNYYTTEDILKIMSEEDEEDEEIEDAEIVPE